MSIADLPRSVASLRGTTPFRRGLTALRRLMTGVIQRKHAALGPRRKNSSRRGRTAILWAVGAFVLLQLAYYPAVTVWPMLHDVEYGEKLKHLRSHLADKPKDKPSVVMFGSSLTGWGFNPSQLETVRPNEPGQPVVFNFAINSSGTIGHLVCIRRMLADGIRPDLVLLETHPVFFSRMFNTVPGEHYLEVWRYQRQDLDVLRRYDPKFAEFRKEWREFERLPWATRRREVQKYLVPRWGRRVGPADVLWTWSDRNGWEIIPPALAHFEKMKRELRPPGSYNLPLQETFKKVYREIVETCQREGIPIMLIRLPDTSDSRTSYGAGVRRETEEFYADFTNEMNIRMIDASDWVADNDFADGFHLHPRGAAVFTKRLEREFLGSFLAHPSPAATKLY